jgi:hypothetical protein
LNYRDSPFEVSLSIFASGSGFNLLKEARTCLEKTKNEKYLN